jgi:hypothetical protein
MNNKEISMTHDQYLMIWQYDAITREIRRYFEKLEELMNKPEFKEMREGDALMDTEWDGMVFGDLYDFKMNGI